jgi:hypothetical protein
MREQKGLGVRRAGEEGFGRERSERHGTAGGEDRRPGRRKLARREVKEKGERDDKKMGRRCCFRSGSKAHITDSCYFLQVISMSISLLLPSARRRRRTMRILVGAALKP